MKRLGFRTRAPPGEAVDEPTLTSAEMCAVVSQQLH